MDPKNYTVHEDGSKVPTWDYIEEAIRKLNAGDPDYLASLITMERNPETGNYEPLD